MNLVDSSGWIEYLADTPQADNFKKPIENLSKLVVPTIIIYEVFKHALKFKGKEPAELAAAIMHRGIVAELNSSIALQAAELSCTLKIPMADSIILATAVEYNAVLWTQDEHFQHIKGVKYFPK